MDDDARVIDKGWDALPDYADKSGDADDAVTVSISTTPGEWLVNTNDAVVVPMSMAELVVGLRQGKLSERSLVWRAGMQEWAPVTNVPQLTLAARLPSAPVQSVAPAPASVAPRPTPSKPPPKPVRASTPAPASVAPHALPSRKATLPFGLPNPVASQSRPANARPSSPRHAAVTAPPRSEEPEVLAVYARPAATISFDLSPEQPLRARAPAAPAPPGTLAPITSDSARRRVPTLRNADLSVVAASQFREVQRSSKRLVWFSSLASAAAASLLTFWIASHSSRPSGAAAGRAEPLVALPAAPAAAVPTPPSAAEVAPSASVTPAAEAAPAEVTVAKPKPFHKPKALSVAAAPKLPRMTDDAASALRDPGAEPNPYDVKLEENAPPPKPTAAAARSVGLEADAKGSDASASSATSPGF
jgi:GYF domain 2